MTKLVLLGLVATLGCGGDDDDEDGPADAAVDAAPGADAAADAGGDSGADAGVGPEVRHVVVPETDGTLELDFTLDAEGAGTDRVGAISVIEDDALIEVDGESLVGVTYQHQDWAKFGYDLFQVLLVGPDRWVVVWLYCTDAVLTNLYSVSTDGTELVEEAAEGTCSFLAQDTSAQVSLPATDMTFDTLVNGYRVTGDDLHIDGDAPGILKLGADEMNVLVFQDVNCSSVCGDPGWFELHAILWDPAAARACFGIFYLYEDDRPVLFTYSLTLPELYDPAGNAQIDATWELIDF